MTNMNNYRVVSLLMDMSWFDFDWGVPSSYLVSAAKLPSAQSELGIILKIHMNPTQGQMQMGYPVLVTQ